MSFNVFIEYTKFSILPETELTTEKTFIPHVYQNDVSLTDCIVLECLTLKTAV